MEVLQPLVSKTTIFKSRSQVFRSASPAAEALSCLLRPASTSEPKTIWTADNADASNPSTDTVLGLALPAAPVPPAPSPPTIPTDTDLIIPTSPTPSTIASASSSNSSATSWTPERGLIRRKRNRRRLDAVFPDTDTAYQHDFAQLVAGSCTVLDHIVLELFDVQRLDWTMIAEPVQRVYGIEVSSAGVLGVLQRHGRMQRTVWWD